MNKLDSIILMGACAPLLAGVLLLLVPTSRSAETMAGPDTVDIRATVAPWNDDTILRELAETLHSDFADDIDVNRVLLGALRVRRLSVARDQLRNFLEQIEPPEEPYVKRVDPQRAIEYEVRATLLSFEMDDRGLDTVAKRAGHLFGVIEQKLQHGKGAVNSEVILLRENAGTLTKILLNILDTSQNPRVRDVALDIARSSDDGRLEGEILDRIAKAYGDDGSLFERMLGVLGEIGTDRTLDYISDLLEMHEAQVRPIALACVARLARKGHNEQVRARAQSLLNREAEEQSPAPEPVEQPAPHDADDRPKKGPRDEPKVTFARPEEVGEDLSTLSSSELVLRLAAPYHRIVRRKAAKALRDRAIARDPELSVDEQDALADAVRGYLRLCKSTDPNERSEGRLQIQRLWRVAVPVLLSELRNEEACVAETAGRLLSLMQDESIVRAVISKARTAKSERARATAVLALMNMKYPGQSLIPGREGLDREDSRILYEEVIAPALRGLNRK